MSLTSSYDSSEAYFEDVLTFLKQYQWIYNYPNTHILINNMLSSFPANWLEYFQHLSHDDVNQLSSGILNNNQSCPEDFVQFISKIKELKPTYIQETHKESVMPKFYRLSLKKAHEISNFAPFVEKINEKHCIKNVVDFGAGLGYLSHLLYSNYNFKVLGIEGSNEKCKIALANQDNYYKDSQESVIFHEHFVTNDSVEYLQETIEQNFNSDVCIVGLHACADLSITILDIFLKIDCIKSMVIMPCCYHRLQCKINEDQSETFQNFPKSSVLKRLFEKHKAESFIRRSFLRNACQYTSATISEMSENEHEVHGKNLLFRAILQAVAFENELRVNRKKRKTGRSLKIDETDGTSVRSYVDNLMSLFSFVPEKNAVRGQLNMDKIKEQVEDKWEEHSGKLHLVEILTSLQSAIQSLSENLVLLDRIEYLRENRVESAVFKITDDRISPRCLALAAFK